MKGKISRVLATVLCLGIVGGVATSVSACGGKSDKLVIWAWDENFNIKAANEAKKYYDGEMEISVVNMAQSDIVAKLNTAFSSGVATDMPDIVLIEDYRAHQYLTNYDNSLMDLSSYLDKTKFAEYKVEAASLDGKIYGVPFDSGVAGLFYRTDMLEGIVGEGEGCIVTDAAMQSGVTWSQYIEIGKALKEKTGKALLTLDPSDIGQIRMMMQSAGSWYVDDAGKAYIQDNEALKEGIEVYKKLNDAGVAKSVSDWNSFVQAFQQGDVATVPTGCWIAPSISAKTDQSGKWKVAPLPRLEATKNASNYSNLGGGAWYVLNSSKHKEESAKFLASTFGSNLDLMNALAKEIQLVSSLKDAKTLSNYTTPNAFFSDQKIFEDFSNWTAQIPAVTYGNYTYDAESIMATQVKAFVQGTQTLETTLSNGQTEVAKLIK